MPKHLKIIIAILVTLAIIPIIFFVTCVGIIFFASMF